MCGPKIYRFLGGINRAMLGVPAEVWVMWLCDNSISLLVWQWDAMQYIVEVKQITQWGYVCVCLFPHQHAGNDTIAILICGFRSLDVSQGKIIKHLMLQAFTTDGHEAWNTPQEFILVNILKTFQKVSNIWNFVFIMALNLPIVLLVNPDGKGKHGGAILWAHHPVLWGHIPAE